MSISAITVANFFVRKGIEEQDSGMTPMKVLKLSYIYLLAIPNFIMMVIMLQNSHHNC